jgi:hypothetical protein
MTQHLMQEQTDEDQRTMRRLATVVCGFIVFTIILALGVGFVMG